MPFVNSKPADGFETVQIANTSMGSVLTLVARYKDNGTHAHTHTHIYIPLITKFEIFFLFLAHMITY